MLVKTKLYKLYKCCDVRFNIRNQLRTGSWLSLFILEINSRTDRAFSLAVMVILNIYFIILKRVYVPSLCSF